MNRYDRESPGFTLIELLIALALASLILVATSGLVNNAVGTERLVTERNQLQRDARFAMQRMARAVRETPQLILPMPDKPDTDWRENVREETIPASAPEGSSIKATAVLAVCLSATVDLDGDGFPDADNDRDGRLDEDYPADIAYDFDPGIHLIDDGGDGFVDESFSDNDDDERLNGNNEDPLNGIDDDGDGVIDEDPGADMNADGAPGLAGVDDDNDGQVDEGSANDDDEDGVVDEDWLDAVVFYLQGDSLIERHPVPWDETANGFVSGRDFLESVIAERVTRFRVERPVPGGSGAQLVDLTLELTGPTGRVVSLSSRVRVGGAL
ncbi:MAG: prepilin-type N-terminal cleavage/methylation domain-containing protein [Gammaproteobacteria bacterium]|nr:prepilin-type N-terminal cleavage/methylation domain-containing protein [Gammaproteobacteria bacterium]